MPDELTLVHLFIMSRATGDPSVFLVERRPGVVEFPTLLVPTGDHQEEQELVQMIEHCTGMTVSPTRYVDPPDGALLCPPGSRFLVARLLAGRPRIEGPHVGWEWRPAVNLLSLHFLPKLMVDELRSYMNG